MRILASEIDILVECVKAEGIYLSLDKEKTGLIFFACNDAPRDEIIRLIRTNKKLLVNYLKTTGYHDA